MKNHRLLSTPIPHSDESPASILIRATQGNRYENVHQLVEVTKLNENQACLELLINYLDRFLKLAAALYLQCIAPEDVLERKGPTTRSLRRFFKHFFPASFFRQDGTAFCPACLHENAYLRKVWILKPYAVCHIHSLPIQTDCPHCQEEMKISRASIRCCCRCGCDITLAPKHEKPDEISSWVKSFVNEQSSDTEVFTKIFSWAKSILDEGGEPKDDIRAATITYCYFNNQKNFQESLIEFIGFDKRHPKLKLLPLLSGSDDLSNIAKDLVNNRYKDIPYSEADLRCQLSLSEASTLLSVSHTTMANLLNRIKARRFGREVNFSLNELMTILNADNIRKKSIKSQNKGSLLSIEDVANQLQVHQEIIRSLQKADYLAFERQTIAGSLKYMTTPDKLTNFRLNYVLVGTLAKKLGVNSTDLTAKLAAINIHPVATPRTSVLKTCLFRYCDVYNLTQDAIFSVKYYSTNAGRKTKEAAIVTPQVNAENVSVLDVCKRLDLSVQKVKTLIQSNILKRTHDPRTGVFVTKFSLDSLSKHLKNTNFISIDAAANDLQINKTLLKREWISAGLVEYRNFIYWEFVKVSDIRKIKEIKSEYVNGMEASEILGMHRTHATNLYKRGLIERHYFDKERKIPLYKRTDILHIKNT